MFEIFVVVALAFTAYQLWRLVRNHEATNRLIVAALKLPPEDVLVTDGTVSAGLSIDHPETVVEELRQFARLIAYRLRNIEGVVAYLRNYTWEQLDQRTREEVEHPRPSSQFQGKIFQAPDADTYGLWSREQDWSRAEDEIVGFSKGADSRARNRTLGKEMWEEADAKATAAKEYAGDILALYNHWLRTAQAKGLDDSDREALWHVVITIHAALMGEGKSEADLAWRQAFSHQGAALIRRAIAEAGQRRAAVGEDE